MKLEHLEICFYVHFSASYWLKHIKICLTRDWNVDREMSNNCILTDFEKLLYRSQSFAQTNFYSYIEKILSKFNHQKLNPFEGLAHGENYFYSRSIFIEEKCILSKLNYFKRKEERNVYKNHFVRSYEIEKEDWSI